MKSRPRIGQTAEIRFSVTKQHIIDFATHGMPEILSTPWLIWFLEHTAREAMLPFLEPTESTVGIQVEVEHLAASPIGANVTCQAKVIFSDKSQFSFELRAWDDAELICKGTHKLRVIQINRLAANVAKKLS
ncbi:MAG: Fluoroacetyl-CoA thioesterase [Verrucomicrobia subdivision 3 bacterium]|nr:Fluoroacetyl-CoA thioesterase [Limisphaerales bacterium]MCS1414337.1 Fluoroacetyl-CoA thioesterase [Limisphaerales bacterium]